MNDFLKKNSFSVLLVLVTVIIFWVYTTFISPSQEETGAFVPQNPAEEITSNLGTLQSISFDGSLFSSQEFKNLRQFPLIVPQQALGRTNPFAPTQ